MTHHALLRATEPWKTTTHLVRHTDTQTVTLGPAAGLVGVFDANSAFLAVEIGATAEAAAWLMGAGRRRGRLGACGGW